MWLSGSRNCGRKRTEVGVRVDLGYDLGDSRDQKAPEFTKGRSAEGRVRRGQTADFRTQNRTRAVERAGVEQRDRTQTRRPQRLRSSGASSDWGEFKKT